MDPGKLSALASALWGIVSVITRPGQRIDIRIKSIIPLFAGDWEGFEKVFLNCLENILKKEEAALRSSGSLL